MGSLLMSLCLMSALTSAAFVSRSMQNKCSYDDSELYCAALHRTAFQLFPFLESAAIVVLTGFLDVIPLLPKILVIPVSLYMNFLFMNVLMGGDMQLKSRGLALCN